jgi:hypothetical protein
LPPGLRARFNDFMKKAWSCSVALAPVCGTAFMCSAKDSLPSSRRTE